MHLPGEDNGHRFSTPVIYTIVTVSVLVLIILTFVFLNNNQNPSRREQTLSATKAALKTNGSPSPQIQFAEGQEDIEALYKDHKLRSEDLDFWDMYEQNVPVIEAVPTASPAPTASPELTEEQKAKDGKHLLVSYKDGTREWIEINEDIPLHEYDFTKMKAQNNRMAYYEEDKKLSRLGMVLSNDSGKIDFEALKANGVDFVMLKVGARGYETGVITPDITFENNIAKAIDAGVKVGVIFYSQAVTVVEAAEEAKFVIEMIKPYDITYPVAFGMENVLYDTSRTDILDAEQKTQIAKTFLQAIKSEGYFPILYGSRQWLLTEVVPKELFVDFEVWLSDQNPVPDYPYQFRMWEYAYGEKMAGVEEEVSYTISFTDYSKR